MPKSSNPNKIDFALFAALPEELDYLNNYFKDFKCNHIGIDKFNFKVYEYKTKKILIAYTGMGTTFAACTLTLIHDHFHPDYVFLSGTAGGISPEMKLNDVVVAEKAFEAEIQNVFPIVIGTPFESCLIHPLNHQSIPSVYSANTKLLRLVDSIVSATKIYKGTVVTSNVFPAPQELFEKIKHKNPLCIDMETSAFYQTAWLLNIPVLAIRGISNILNPNGTDDHVHESDVKGSATAAARVVLQVLDQLLILK